MTAFNGKSKAAAKRLEIRTRGEVITPQNAQKKGYYFMPNGEIRKITA